MATRKEDRCWNGVWYTLGSGARRYIINTTVILSAIQILLQYPLERERWSFLQSPMYSPTSVVPDITYLETCKLTISPCRNQNEGELMFSCAESFHFLHLRGFMNRIYVSSYTSYPPIHPSIYHSASFHCIPMIHPSLV